MTHCPPRHLSHLYRWVGRRVGYEALPATDSSTGPPHPQLLSCSQTQMETRLQFLCFFKRENKNTCVSSHSACSEAKWGKENHGRISLKSQCLTAHCRQWRLHSWKHLECEDEACLSWSWKNTCSWVGCQGLKEDSGLPCSPWPPEVNIPKART